MALRLAQAEESFPNEPRFPGLPEGVAIEPGGYGIFKIRKWNPRERAVRWSDQFNGNQRDFLTYVIREDDRINTQVIVRPVEL